MSFFFFWARTQHVLLLLPIAMHRHVKVREFVKENGFFMPRRAIARYTTLVVCLVHLFFPLLCISCAYMHP